MKKVFRSHSEVAHIWANRQQPYGESGNIFFDGKIIYSYGTHFAIAAHYKDIVLFTLRDYSVSTAKHKSIVRSAIHQPTIYCYNVQIAFRGKQDKTVHNENIEYWLKRIEEEYKSMAKARKPEIYAANILSEQQQLQTYAEYFKIRLTKAQREYMAAPEEVNDLRTLIIKRTEEEAAKRAKLLREQIQKFKSFELNRLYQNSEFDVLRYNKEKERVETSQGVHIEKEEAIRAYRFIQAAIQKNINSGGSIAGYRVNTINEKYITIGCHKIKQTEVDEVFAQI